MQKKQTTKPSNKKQVANKPEKPAYLIVEKIAGVVHVYMESEAHYENAKDYRFDSIKLPAEMLEYECNLEAYGNDVHFVFKLA